MDPADCPHCGGVNPDAPLEFYCAVCGTAYPGDERPTIERDEPEP